MQQRIQKARAVKPDEALGVEERADMNMFTNTWDKLTKVLTSFVVPKSQS